MFLDVLEELDGALKLPAIDGLSCLAGVLEGNSEVCASGFRGFTGVHLCCCVSDLYNISISPLSSRSSVVDLWYCEVSVWDRPDCSSTQRHCRKHLKAFCPIYINENQLLTIVAVLLSMGWFLGCSNLREMSIPKCGGVGSSSSCRLNILLRTSGHKLQFGTHQIFIPREQILKASVERQHIRPACLSSRKYNFISALSP